MHLLAAAAALLSVDCSAATDLLPTGTWVRGVGYDDAFLAERRHPTTDELDAAVPDHPVVLHHRTGHAVLRNRAAEGRQPPRIGDKELALGVAAVSRDMAAAGITAVTDATVTNGEDARDLLAGLVSADAILQRVTFMPGWSELAAFEHGEGDDRFRIGPAKIVPRPDEDLAAMVGYAHRRGFPVAIHVLDVEPLEQALAALAASPPPRGTVDRIEHNALSLPEQVDRMAELGVCVVTQPSFLLHRAAKYRQELSPVEHAWLYRVRSLLEAGVTVRASSDAPVVPARPLESVAMACAHPFAPAESVDHETALALVTGDPSDRVVLDADPRSAPLEEVHVVATWRGDRRIF